MVPPLQKLTTGRIISATLIKLLLNTGRRFVYPFAPALSRSLDVPLTAVTSIIATSQAVSLIGLFSGPIADRTGYRFMMQCGLAMLALGMLICGLVPTYWPVFAGLVLASFGKIIFDPAIQAFVGLTVPYSKRGRVIGLLEISWAGSTLVGIPALALIIDRVGLQTSFFVLAFLGGLGWLGVGRIIAADRSRTPAESKRSGIAPSLFRLLKSRPAAGMLAYAFWISLANDCLFVVYGAWFEQAFLASVVTIGFSTIAIGSAELLGESLTTLFADRIGLKRSVLLGLSLAVCAYFLLPLIGRSLPLAMAGMFLVFLTFEFTMVTSFSLCTELLPESRATMMAGFYATAGIGRMLGVVVGGLLWQSCGIAGVSRFSAVLTCLGMVSVIWGLKNWHPDRS